MAQVQITVPTISVKRIKSFIKKNKKILGVLLIILIAVVPSLFFYNQSRQANEKLKNPGATDQREVSKIVGQVGNHVLLPTNEQPTLATVSDSTKLTEDRFFSQAQNGDKVLVYAQAKKAILYRPSADRIVEIAPLNIDTSSGPNQ